jgi:hypothetical protein
LKVKYNGRVVDPGSINWSSVNLANVAFVQAPGPTNVLGKLKFLYPNKHIVYMHDTIKKGLFNTDAIVTVTGRALTDRALFVDELRVQGTSLRGAAFAPALDTRDAGRLVAALEMIRACGRGLEIPNLHQLTRHEDAAVRAAALRVVPYDLRRRTFEDTLLGALSDADDGVRIAAIAVLGEFGSHEAIPGVARCLRAANPLVVVASAHALAALGPVGRRRLEAALLHGAGEAPAAALEALGQLNSRPYAGAR